MSDDVRTLRAAAAELRGRDGELAARSENFRRAVADWLDDVADDHERHAGGELGSIRLFPRPDLAVANAVIEVERGA